MCSFLPLTQYSPNAFCALPSSPPPESELQGLCLASCALQCLICVAPGKSTDGDHRQEDRVWGLILPAPPCFPVVPSGCVPQHTLALWGLSVLHGSRPMVSSNH